MAEALRDLARRLYRALQREDDYPTFDAAVDEPAAVNGWTFTAEDEHFG